MAAWEPTAQGATVGHDGPEGGFIERDESTPSGIRLIFEADASRSFYSVTCFIPDWLMHARFFDKREDALFAYEAMRVPLEELARALPERRPPPGHADTFAAGAKLAEFTVRFP